MARFLVNYSTTGKTLFATDNEREVIRWLSTDMLGVFVVYDKATCKTLNCVADVAPVLREVPIVVPNRDVLPEDR
jgi:hypothetical protein